MSRERGEKAGDRGDRLERSERGGDRGDRLDRARTPATKRSFSKEVEERSRERPSQPEGLRKAASLTEDRDRGRDAGETGKKGCEEGAVWLWFNWSAVVLGAPDCLLGKSGAEELVCFLTAVKREATLPPVNPPKATLSEEELEKKSKAIIEEYLHLNDMKVGDTGLQGRGCVDV